MKILITGGTGSLGRALVGGARGAGYAIRVMSRGPRPQSVTPDVEWAQADLASGDGVGAALDRVDAVIHAASDPRRADAVDVKGTRNLVEAARWSGVAHIVYVSIVGVDDIPTAYYKQKRVAEKIIESSGLPHSILRATQFHSLVDVLFSKAARLPVMMPLPTDFKCQSVVESEVAERLLLCLANGPRGRVADFGGPEVLSVGEMAETWLALNRLRRRLIHVPVPGAVAAGFRAGKNTAPEGARGVTRWQQWLMRRVESKAA